MPQGHAAESPGDATRPTITAEPSRVFADLLMRCAWTLVDSVWDVSTLWLLRDGDWHAVWVSYLDIGDHWGWYVSLQEPFRRAAQGI